MAEVLPTIRLSFTEQGWSVVLMQTALWWSLSQGINFRFQRFEESRCHLLYRHVRTDRHEEVGQVGGRVQARPQRPQQRPPDAADLGNVAGDVAHTTSPLGVVTTERAGLFAQVPFRTTFSYARCVRTWSLGWMTGLNSSSAPSDCRSKTNVVRSPWCPHSVAGEKWAAGHQPLAVHTQPAGSTRYCWGYGASQVALVVKNPKWWSN